MYPQANIPVIQISLLQSLDPEKHFNMGKALR
jgi:4,5-DOPA dioxygenase extradiol